MAYKDSSEKGSSKMYGVSRLPKGTQQTPSGDVGKHRAQEAYVLGTFSGCESMTREKAGWKAMRDDSAMDSFPAFKSPGRIAGAGSGHDGNNVSVDPNVGSGLAPKKNTPFTGYAKVTKPPMGRALPERGEGEA